MGDLFLILSVSLLVLLLVVVGIHYLVTTSKDRRPF